MILNLKIRIRNVVQKVSITTLVLQDYSQGCILSKCYWCLSTLFLSRIFFNFLWNLYISLVGENFQIYGVQITRNCISENSLFPRGLWAVAWEMLVSFVSTEVQFKNTFFYSIVTVDLATAKDLLLLASTVNEQKQWVQNLSNKIEYRSSANSTGMRAIKK